MPIWSKEQRDIQTNLEWVLTPAHTHDCTIRELANFDRQVFRLNTHRDMFRSMMTLLLDTPRNGRPSEPRDWFKAWCEQHKGQVISEETFRHLEIDEWLLDEDEIESELGIRYAPPSYDGASDAELSDCCEQRRAKIKQLWPVVEVYRDVLRLLITYKAGAVRTNQDAKHFVVSRLLYQWSKRNQKKLMPILEEVGFPVGRMPTILPFEQPLPC